MKILFIFGYRHPVSFDDPFQCGGQVQPFFQLRELARRGHYVTVLCRGIDGEPRRQDFGGVHILRYISRSQLLGDNQTTSLSLHRLIDFVRLIRRDQYDVVATTTPAVFESMTAKKRGIPLIHINHGVLGLFTQNLGWKPKELLRRVFIRGLSIPAYLMTLRNAGGIVGVCRDDIDVLKHHYKIPHRKLVLIYNGVDINHYSPQGDTHFFDKHNLSPETPIILSVGRISKEKGLHYLLEAAPKILNKHPKTKFVIVGIPSMPEYLEELIQKSKKMNWASNFIFNTNLPEKELPSYYRAATLCTAYSDGYDPFPNTILQAMSSGKTIVSSDIPARRELIKDGITGIMVPPGNSSDLAQIIIKLIEQKDIVKRIGKTARKFVESERNLINCVDSYEALMRTRCKIQG